MASFGILDPPIPLVPHPEVASMTEITVKREVQIAGNNQTRSASLVFLDNETAAECVLRAIKCFKSQCTADSMLRLTQGGEKFQYFRQIIGGAAADAWDTVITQLAGTTTNAHFNEGLRLFVRCYTSVSALMDQSSYMENTKKPMSIPSRALGIRVRFINQLLAPLTADGNAPWDEERLKVFLYKMMPQRWQGNLLTAGHSIVNPNYTVENLIDFMLIQEQAPGAASSERRNQNRSYGSRSRGGRSVPTFRSSRGYPQRRQFYQPYYRAPVGAAYAPAAGPPHGRGPPPGRGNPYGNPYGGYGSTYGGPRGMVPATPTRPRGGQRGRGRASPRGRGRGHRSGGREAYISDTGPAFNPPPIPPPGPPPPPPYDNFYADPPYEDHQYEAYHEESYYAPEEFYAPEHPAPAYGEHWMDGQFDFGAGEEEQYDTSGAYHSEY